MIIIVVTVAVIIIVIDIVPLSLSFSMAPRSVVIIAPGEPEVNAAVDVFCLIFQSSSSSPLQL